MTRRAPTPNRGIAVCLLHGSETVCEAYADMEIKGIRELGVTTHKAYRRQGFATITCAYLIKLCEESGSSTYWDCARFNAGSVSLARKLGFQNQREYKLLAWFKSPEM
jgi:predicted GNAT family acetyltransferase